MFSLRFYLVLFLTIFFVAQTYSSFAQDQEDEFSLVFEETEGVSAENPEIGDVINDVINETADDVELTPVDTLTGDPLIEEMVRRSMLYGINMDPTQFPSLFFTMFEQKLLADARQGLVARPPTQAEIDEAEQRSIWEEERVMGPREISLGGIVYLSSGDWTIWLNEQKVTPNNIPPEIVDIRVYKNFVKLKWFDSYTNQIYPVKMRTHQRFNIDTRIFLPG